MYYDADVQLDPLLGKKIAIIGYGSQGHAHALNLRDSGLEVIVGLYQGSSSWQKAEMAGLTVKTTAEAAQIADVVMILLPDEVQRSIYLQEIAPHLKPGDSLAFAHGFNIHFAQVVPPPDVDVFMVLPKVLVIWCAVPTNRDRVYPACLPYFRTQRDRRGRDRWLTPRELALPGRAF